MSDQRLAYQSRGRELSADERALASALGAIYARGIHDFAEVARELNLQNVVAPVARVAAWTPELLARELAAINASLDEACATDGFGA